MLFVFERVGWNCSCCSAVTRRMVVATTFCAVSRSYTVCRCGKVKYVKTIVITGGAPASGYHTETEVLIHYTGGVVVNVDGCVSGNRYKFAPNSIRTIDSNDAPCIVEMNGFSYV